MDIKRILLASSGLALVCAATEAQANNQLYVSAFGGANWTRDESASQFLSTQFGGSTFLDSIGIGLDSETGFVVGGAIGIHLDSWVKGLRGEVEVSYRRNRLQGEFFTTTSALDSGVNFDDTSGEGVANGHSSVFAVMANVWYDFSIGGKVKPYIGGGIGWAESRTSFSAVYTFPDDTDGYFSDEESGFAYQLGAGFNYEVAPDVRVGLGYRYFKAPDTDIFFFGKESDAVAHLNFDNANHSVMLSLTIDITP